MQIDPLNQQGDLWIAEKGFNQLAMNEGRRWLEILAGQGGMTNVWLGLIGSDSTIDWLESLYPSTMPDQFSADVIQEVAGGGRSFIFVDRAELISGALFPLKRNDVVRGFLGVVSDQTDFFKPPTVQWMNTFCSLIAECLFQPAGGVDLREVEYSIARALQSSLEVYDVLPAVLQELGRALNVDAATVLKHDPLGRRQKLLATFGLDSTLLAKFNFHLDVAATVRQSGNRMVWIGDLMDKDRQMQPISPFKEEGFRSYLAIPLISDGNPSGILELAWRSPHVISWDANLLERVSGQIAHAINRADVLNRYRHVTAELASRYNAMIEGLSRALELRDLETEGHTRRVSRLTMRLVEHMDIPADQWDAIRQGALLHDIGKIGIPDAILLKPGSLTVQERKVMQQHVTYGYNILAPIIDLRPVLDIALYHHEHWDGSGYPYGLKGEQIPLVARLFAVVDVFDALTSDRPYRTAWSRTQALEFIREQAGRLFDPKVVELFLEVVDSEE